jgi:plastocyanin
MPARATFAVSALIAALVSGCGSYSSSGTAKPANRVPSAPASTTPASAAAGPARSSATVDIKSFAYKPVTIAVKKGGRIRWTNSDTAAHTATADNRSFDTQTIDIGKARTVTFTTAGTFPYHCDFHPFMKATVIVK